MSVATEVAAAASDRALAHFAESLAFETDCWDVQSSLSSSAPDFILLDVRSAEMFAKGHIAGAINMPHGKIIVSKLELYPKASLFVCYCAGPHCNGATRGAIRLAKLGRPVKIMIGGITGWLDEGFGLAT
jgi:rhodanese-related sulfurtransferase